MHTMDLSLLPSLHCTAVNSPLLSTVSVPTSRKFLITYFHRLKKHSRTCNITYYLYRPFLSQKQGNGLVHRIHSRKSSHISFLLQLQSATCWSQVRLQEEKFRLNSHARLQVAGLSTLTSSQITPASTTKAMCKAPTFLTGRIHPPPVTGIQRTACSTSAHIKQQSVVAPHVSATHRLFGFLGRFGISPSDSLGVLQGHLTSVGSPLDTTNTLPTLLMSSWLHTDTVLPQDQTSAPSSGSLLFHNLQHPHCRHSQAGK